MKNTMMRIASILMVVALLTACVISGTFAKYVTSTSAEDTARVAKWGIVITKTGDGLFKDKYETDETGNDAYTGTYTVEAQVAEGAEEADNVVAPGTTNADDPLTFSISGTPEVAVRVVYTFADGFKEVKLPQGEYRDYTVSDPDAKFTLSEDYYPVVFTLKEGTGDNATTIATGKLADIITAVEAAAAEYAPGTEFNTSFTLTWEWDFDDNGAGTNDKADTLLGNIAAGVATVEGAVTEINFNIAITVTQID